MKEKFRIRDFLNKIKWDYREKADDYVISYVSRGAPGDVEEISGDLIKKVYTRGFETIEGKYIPFHRIIKIINNKSGEIIFITKKYSFKIEK